MDTKIADNLGAVAIMENGRERTLQRRKIGDEVRSIVACGMVEQDKDTRTDISGGTSVSDTTVSFAVLLVEGFGTTDPKNGKSASA